MPERLNTARKIIGTKQLTKALRAGDVAVAYVAEDADPLLREPLVAQCEAARVPIVYVHTMKELGRFCRIHVGAACAGLLKDEA